MSPLVGENYPRLIQDFRAYSQFNTMQEVSSAQEQDGCHPWDRSQIARVAKCGLAGPWFEPERAHSFYTKRRNVTTEMCIRGRGCDRNLLPRGGAPYT